MTGSRLLLVKRNRISFTGIFNSKRVWLRVVLVNGGEPEDGDNQLIEMQKADLIEGLLS
ncbi:hypothetical protein [Serratia fonticola]|uniref:hypothetical protein n=1 Tax=Serratia fonticola TaxID=47917 RepID=UPI001315196C|nr:hypothetical protein [Serratia fonticola]